MAKKGIGKINVLSDMLVLKRSAVFFLVCTICVSFFSVKNRRNYPYFSLPRVIIAKKGEKDTQAIICVIVVTSVAVAR